MEITLRSFRPPSVWNATPRIVLRQHSAEKKVAFLVAVATASPPAYFASSLTLIAPVSWQFSGLWPLLVLSLSIFR